jgi:outer membrane protein
MKRWGSLLMLCLLSAPYQKGGQNAEKNSPPLTLKQCIAFALEHHPDIRAAAGAADASFSRVRQARSAYYPQVAWTSDIGRSAVGSRTSFGFTTRSVTYNSYTSAIALSQNITDFGRTAGEVRIREMSHEAALADLEGTSDEIVLGVKQAYFAVLLAKRNREVTEQAVKRLELHLEQAKGFFEAGTKPMFDVTKAEVDLTGARLNLIKARNSVKLAGTGLNNAMGVSGAAGAGNDVEDVLTFDKFEISFDEALDTARRNRPDLRSIEMRRRAAESSVALARRGFFPVLSGSADYSYGGNMFPLQPGWTIGLSLTVPVFNGFLTAFQVRESRANLGTLRAQEESTAQTVILEIQQALLGLQEAEEAIPVAELAVKQAEENFALADGSYAEGLGDPIQVADAAAALVGAKMAYFGALYDYRIARAGLEKAMGTR